MKTAPVQGYAAGIPWDMHLRAYDAYCKRYGKQQSLIEGSCRGGFGTNELDVFIPGWREELDERTKLRGSLDYAALLIVCLARKFPQDDAKRELALSWLINNNLMPDTLRGASKAIKEPK